MTYSIELLNIRRVLGRNDPFMCFLFHLRQSEPNPWPVETLLLKPTPQSEQHVCFISLLEPVVSRGWIQDHYLENPERSRWWRHHVSSFVRYTIRIEITTKHVWLCISHVILILIRTVKDISPLKLFISPPPSNPRIRNQLYFIWL